MKNLKQWYSGLNIYYRLIPFLLLYISIILIFNKNDFVSDEDRYFAFANNIINGNLSVQYADVNLLGGPGYPLFLVPFQVLNLPLIFLKLPNAFLLYFSLVIVYKTMCFYSPQGKAFLFTTLLGLYYPIFEMLPRLLTECLTWFLISLLSYLFIKSYHNNSWKMSFLTAFVLAYLVITKVIFGYVIFTMLALSVVLFLIPKSRRRAKHYAAVFLLSLTFCLPWLLYTYSLTGIPFYWASCGSNSLYTMSSPYENELGDWQTDSALTANPNHRAFMQGLANLTPGEMDKAYYDAAINNIRAHPIKFTSNWMANIGRLLFSYPYSFTDQSIKTYFILTPNMFVVVLLVLTLPVSIRHFRRFPEELILLFIFVFIYLSGSTLVSGFRRIFYISMPFWLLYFSFVFNNIILIKIRK